VNRSPPMIGADPKLLVQSTSVCGIRRRNDMPEKGFLLWHPAVKDSSQCTQETIKNPGLSGV
jgi:hypothetical protein